MLTTQSIIAESRRARQPFSSHLIEGCWQGSHQPGPVLGAMIQHIPPPWAQGNPAPGSSALLVGLCQRGHPCQPCPRPRSSPSWHWIIPPIAQGGSTLGRAERGEQDQTQMLQPRCFQGKGSNVGIGRPPPFTKIHAQQRMF